MKQNFSTENLSYQNSWELLLEIKHIISRKVFQDCLGVKASQEYRYCLSPDKLEYRRNPADRLRNLVEVLVEKEGITAAHALINYIAEPLGCRLTSINSPKPDKNTILDECIDDYCEKTKLDELIRSNANIELIQQQADICKREIDETVVMYKEKISG